VHTHLEELDCQSIGSGLLTLFLANDLRITNKRGCDAINCTILATDPGFGSSRRENEAVARIPASIPVKPFNQLRLREWTKIWSSFQNCRFLLRKADHYSIGLCDLEGDRICVGLARPRQSVDRLVQHRCDPSLFVLCSPLKMGEIDMAVRLSKPRAQKSSPIASAKENSSGPLPEELLTVKEAKAFAKVSDATIRRWIRTNQLRAYRLGG
jgi:hypothetical protein